MIEGPTLLNQTFCRSGERFHIESVRSFVTSTSVGERVVVVTLSVQAKSETTTCNRVQIPQIVFFQIVVLHYLSGDKNVLPFKLDSYYPL